MGQGQVMKKSDVRRIRTASQEQEEARRIMYTGRRTEAALVALSCVTGIQEWVGKRRWFGRTLRLSHSVPSCTR